MAEPTINDLDADQVAQAEAFLTAFLKEEYPSMDLTEGRVLRDLLIRPAAIFHVLNQTNIDLVRQSMSVLAIEANPALADPALVDAVFSNYRIVRQVGTKASGNVTIVIRSLLTTPVNQGTTFVANGLAFVTTAAYVGVTTVDAVVNNQQRLIVQRADGTYAFTVPVEAAQAGSQYKVRGNTRFAVTPRPAGFIDAYAAADFAGGTDTQTNADLVAQFKQGISPEVFSGRINIEAAIRQLVPTLHSLSIVGFGDEEMLRDRHNIFAISTGGKADIFTRVQPLPETKLVELEATLIDKAAGKWQLAIARDTAPGFYAIDSVLPLDSADQGTLELTDETRGLDLSPDGNLFIPEVNGLLEGGYSRFQTAVVQFLDPTTDATALIENESKQTYKVTILHMPRIKDVQNLSSDRSKRNPQADYLVRAPVPAFVALSVKILYTDAVDAPDADAVKQAIVERVSGLKFTMGRLPASIVFDALHDVIPRSGAMAVSPLDMMCRIVRPDGTTVLLRSGNELVVPDDPANGVTSRTVAFYLDVTGVDVSVEKVPALPV